MLISFTDIPEHLKYPPAIKGKLSSYHSSIILYAAQNFVSTRKFRRQVINTLNTITYVMVQGDPLPEGWSESSPLLSEQQVIDEFDCKSVLGKLFLSESDIEWDVDEIEPKSDALVGVSATREAAVNPITTWTAPVDTSTQVNPPTTTQSARPTNIEDLSIQPPIYPQVDFSRPWFSRLDPDMGITYAIYPSLPQIPTTQREISITTDVSLIPEYALLDLFPNQIMQTRGSEMYEHVPGLECDDILGVILPIDGYTTAQLRDNIVRYPHLYKLTRIVDGKPVPFHKMIEIDGVLHVTSEIWDRLPDTARIPKTAAFVKEYVVRRYLLERDIHNVTHASKLFGDLSPFLTLFLPASLYTELGYPNSTELAKACVESRVAYKQTRNPVLRRFADE